MGIDHLVHPGMKHQIQHMKIGFDDFNNQPRHIPAEPDEYPDIPNPGPNKQKIMEKPGNSQTGQQSQTDQKRFEMAGQNDPGGKHEYKGEYK
jgi:hypothetical protein